MKSKLIQTKDYLLLIDEEAEVCRGQYRLLNDKVELIHEGHNYPYKGYKIIAYYPLSKEAEELDLLLLPNPFEEVDVERLADKWFLINSYNKEDLIHSHTIPNYITNKNLFIAGYKAAQPKQFSLEDVEKAYRQGWRDKEYFDREIKDGEPEGWRTFEHYKKSLSTQQLPSQFIPEYEYYYHSSKEFYTDAGFVKCSKEQYDSIKEEIPTCPVKVELKTITNSEGKEELVGTCKY